MRPWSVLFALLWIFFPSGKHWAGQRDLLQEIEHLRSRIRALEEKISQHEGDNQLHDASTLSHQIQAIKESIEERFGSFSIHGSVVGYYQGISPARIGGRRFSNPDGAGFATDLEITFRPMNEGEFYLRIHAGEGDGADRDLEGEGALFADLNTLNDDNPDGQFVDLLEAHYTHSLLGGLLNITVGKSEQACFIDQNAFANSEVFQFVGKPFVNNPVLDTEIEYGPLVALQLSPMERLSLVALVESTSNGGQKDVWDDVFDDPFLGAQLTYSPRISGLEGNYRLYGWMAPYEHPDLDAPGRTHMGWGVGISADQWLSRKLGLFARVGYHHEDVYPVSWFVSLGLSGAGILPGRENDHMGIGLAALIAGPDLDDAAVDTGLLLGDGRHTCEYHIEVYYRFALSDHLAITPDLQMVINPLGESGNDEIFSGMLRGEFYF